MSLKSPKYLTSLFLVFLILFPFLASSALAEVKIGIVDMSRIFSEYNKTKKAQSEYESIEQAANKELDGRIAILKKEMNEINKLDIALEKTDLSKEVREAKTKERDEKIAKAREFDRETAEFRSSKQKKFQDQFMEMRKTIINEIMKVVDEQTKIRGFDLVLDKSGLSAGAVPVVLYSRSDLDISTDIISILNKKGDAKK